jgi:hypothetical protein
MEISEEFRKNARQCIKLAQEAHSLESRVHWLGMASLWCILVQHAEEGSFGNSLLPDMARMWITLARQIEPMHGSHPKYDESGRQRVTIN